MQAAKIVRWLCKWSGFSPGRSLLHENRSGIITVVHKDVYTTNAQSSNQFQNAELVFFPDRYRYINKDVQGDPPTGTTYPTTWPFVFGGPTWVPQSISVERGVQICSETEKKTKNKPRVGRWYPPEGLMPVPQAAEQVFFGQQSPAAGRRDAAAVTAALVQAASVPLRQSKVDQSCSCPRGRGRSRR